MRTPLWTAKDVQTGLGSYAELKHDTVLFTKQFVAEGGGEPLPARLNWVEPDPVAFGASRGRGDAVAQRPRRAQAAHAARRRP